MNSPVPLRPLSAGDLLDEAVWLYRKHLLSFLLTVAVLRVPFALVLTAFQNSRDTQPLAFTSLNLLGLALNQLFISSLLSAAFAHAVRSTLDGDVPSPLKTYRNVARSTSRLLANAFVANIAYALVVAVTTVCLEGARVTLLDPLSSFAPSGPLTIIATLTFVAGYACAVGLPLLALNARWSVSQQAIALEGCGPMQAFRRSALLMRGQYRRVMVFLLGLFLLGSLLSTAPSFLSQVVAEEISPSFQRDAWTGIVYILFGAAIPTLLDVLFLPVNFIARALLYYDLRVRAEGFDLSVQVARWAEQAV